MLAYAPRPERRRFSPAALSLIVGAHAVALVAVMTARMNLPDSTSEPPLFIRSIALPDEPKPPKPKAPNTPSTTTYTLPNPVIDPPPMPGPAAEPLPPAPAPNPGVGAAVYPPAPPIDPPVVRRGPRFTTPADDVRPPYPDAMRAQEKEGVLRLRLSIDERGRVVAVDPVGKAEPAFLAAARRHILKAWRYAPAMEGDRAIAASTVITLEFKLDS